MVSTAQHKTTVGRPILIVDGLIPTTTIAERLLRDAYGDVEVVVATAMRGVELAQRPVFLSRVCDPRVSWFVDYFKRNNIAYIYLLDDNFFELTAEYDTMNAAFYGHPAVHQTLERFLLGAHSVWLMSRPLEDYLHRRLPSIATRFLDAPVDIELLDRCASEVGTLSTEDDVFIVGYPSTRRPNVSKLVAAIVRGAYERWGVAIRFEFVGWCPDEITSHPCVNVFPLFGEYDAFLRFMFSRGWNAAIAPLGDSEFENAKTSLKFREYGAARIPGVYSECPLFSACVNHGVDGLLAASSADAWLTQLDLLRSDVPFRNAIALAARKNVEARHSQPRIAEQLREAFSELWRYQC
jgi:glycosyltransferase involved in cell wall biosynthesis